jgi:hypothetical protein
VDALPYDHRLNASLSSATLAAKRHLNGWLVQRNRLNAHGGLPLRVSNAAVLRLLCRLDPLLPPALQRGWNGRWQVLIREVVQDHYAASNAAMCERMGIDLALYGYDVGAG